MAAILNFGGHFGCYIYFYKSKTFLMPCKTFVDIFIGLLQEIALCRCLKDFSQSNRGHLGLSRHCHLKTRVHIDKGFPTMLPAVNKKV